MGGTDYLQVHLFWTIPPALVLWLGLRRLRTNRDVAKTCLLIAIAVVSTTPWDSYLIRNSIWTYPPSSVIGFTFLSIPYEEIFFFFIQTYITANLYAFLSKPVVHVVLLPRSETKRMDRKIKWIGVIGFLSTTVLSLLQIRTGGPGTYLALILGWVTPFLALLWAVASTHILSLPYYASILPIMIPTVYLWICDSVALQRGTWVIVAGTKLGISFRGLEIEEAIFFFLTNVLIVFGLIASDFVCLLPIFTENYRFNRTNQKKILPFQCLAIHDAYPALYPLSSSSSFPSPRSILFSITGTPPRGSTDRLDHLIDAIELLRIKSKSFYIASFAFEGGLRLDLLALYSWCRVVDDLIDDAATSDEASSNIILIQQYLDLIYSSSPHLPTSIFDSPKLKDRITTLVSHFPPSSQSPFYLLSTLAIPRAPLDELLAGFKTDLEFTTHPHLLPIRTDADLFLYANNVASSVAELCVRLVWKHEGFGDVNSVEEREEVIKSARSMGVGLQLVNIARDVAVDLKIGRMYLPGITKEEQDGEVLVRERRRLLNMAKERARESGPVIGRLPESAAGGIRAACEVYLGIGDAVSAALDRGDVESRVRNPSWKRLHIAWKALGARNEKVGLRTTTNTTRKT